MNINIHTFFTRQSNVSFLLNHIFVRLKRHIYSGKYAERMSDWKVIVNKIKLCRNIEYILSENEDYFTKNWDILQL